MTIFDDGANARWCRTSNPHKPESSEWIAWDMGWLDRDQHERERDWALNSIGYFGPPERHSLN